MIEANQANSKLTIRFATHEDAALLAQVGAQTFADSLAADNTPEDMAAYLTASFSPAKQAAQLADLDVIFLIAENAGNVAGFAQLHANVRTTGVGGDKPIELARIYATQEWIGRGVGAALMQASIAEARTRGHDVIWLGVWERNVRAQAFYRKWGFAQVGTHTFQLGADTQTDFVMARRIEAMTLFTLPTIPGEFEWHIQPVESSFDPAKGLVILAGARTDWFNNPAGDPPKDNAPCALFTPPDENFLLSAKVSVAFGSTFDAGTIQIRVRDDLWAKLCFEYSPQGRPMIVSVVTRGVSDDCNSVEIDGAEIYLRVARTPRTLAFHYSHDGRVWNFVRYFSLGQLDAVRVGFSAQSPRGQKCAVTFSEFNYRVGTLKDNRNGE